MVRGADGHIHELFFHKGKNWQHKDLTVAIPGNSPSAIGDPAGCTWGGDGGQHVVYRGVDCHIHELFFQPGKGWQNNDLVVMAGAPALRAAGGPDGYTWDGDGGQHVVFRE